MELSLGGENVRALAHEFRRQRYGQFNGERNIRKPDFGLCPFRRGTACQNGKQVLGLAEGTVKSRLLRGRELLRRKLASYVGKEHV